MKASGRGALAIVGPTASGKTSLSLLLARTMDAEIVSVDSRQVYRGLDVGTAKATAAERATVPHHGLDVVMPGEPYSAGRFARDARGWIADIRARGRLPLLVGGTGFFLKALVEPVFREPPLDPERRARLRDWLRGLDAPELARWAAALDPTREPLARAGGRQRLSRLLEIPLLTGRPLSWWHTRTEPEGEPVNVDVVLLDVPRDELYRRIDARAAAMFEGGLLEETRRLLDAGVGEGDAGMTATGYREAVRVVRGEIGVEEAVELARRGTRAYARRQVTWFRHQSPRPGVVVDATLPLHEQARTIVEWWEGIGRAERGVPSTP